MLQYNERVAVSLQPFLNNNPFKVQPEDIRALFHVDHILARTRGGPNSG